MTRDRLDSKTFAVPVLGISIDPKVYAAVGAVPHIRTLPVLVVRGVDVAVVDGAREAGLAVRLGHLGDVGAVGGLVAALQAGGGPLGDQLEGHAVHLVRLEDGLGGHGEHDFVAAEVGDGFLRLAEAELGVDGGIGAVVDLGRCGRLGLGLLELDGIHAILAAAQIKLGLSGVKMAVVLA